MFFTCLALAVLSVLKKAARSLFMRGLFPSSAVISAAALAACSFLVRLARESLQLYLRHSQQGLLQEVTTQLQRERSLYICVYVLPAPSW